MPNDPPTIAGLKENIDYIQTIERQFYENGMKNLGKGIEACCTAPAGH